MKAPRLTGRGLILCTVFLDALGYGLIIPVLPGILRRFDPDPSFVSQHLGYLIASYAVVQLFAAPLLGDLSDRFGRRPVLLVSLAGAAIDYVLMAYAPTLALLFTGRVVAGLTGASTAVANAYVADISDDQSRAANFGLVAAALGTGIIAGPGAGGLLAQLGPTTPFLVAAALNFATLSAALVLLPESLATSARRALAPGRWSPLSSLRHLHPSSPIAKLVWCYLLIYLAGRATSTLWALFTERRFAWSPVEIGASFAFIGLVMAVAQAALPRRAIDRLGEPRALRVGLGLSMATYVAIAAATQAWMLYAIVAASAGSAVVGPILQSRMSRAMPRDAQGQLQGSLAAIASLTAIAGPLLYTNVFAHTSRAPQASLSTGAPFLLAAAFCLAAWTLVAAKPG